MTDNPTPEQVRESIVPKSDQLNADDLVTGPITVTITKVSRGDREQPITVEIEGHRPYKPCKIMRRVMVAIWSEESKEWIGQRMTLYCDPTVMWGGVKVGGIRISHMTGLEAPRPFLLTTGRGKKQDVTIHPIASLTPEDQQFIGAVTDDLAAAATLDELQGHGKVLASKSKPVQDALRPVYAKRLAELKS
jgi:hypothetical protein